jgi:glycosyltransferase involved in cell wall biosynthesis
MGEMPKVSVIVPNYNHAPFLERRIRTVLDQSFQDFDLLILDDASTDNSREIIESMAQENPRIRTLFSERNSGSPFFQWNVGVRQTEGDLIWIAESDDFSDPRFLETLVRYFDDSEIGLAFCQSYKVWQDGHRRRWSDDLPDAEQCRWQESWKMDGSRFVGELLTKGCCIPNASSVVFRRSVFDSAGGADGLMKMSGDYLLWVMLSSLCAVQYVSEPLNFWYVGGAESPSRKGMFNGTYILEALRVLNHIKSRGLADKGTVENRLKQLVHEWTTVCCGPDYHVSKEMHARIFTQVLQSDPTHAFKGMAAVVRRSLCR